MYYINLDFIEDKEVKFFVFVLLFFFIVFFLISLGSDTRYVYRDPYKIKFRKYKDYYYYD